MLDMVSELAPLFGEEAVLAAILRALTDQMPCLGANHERFEVSLRSALSLRMAIKSAALMSAS
jgi:hypothetical protein